jgi:hypothetical protein
MLGVARFCVFLLWRNALHQNASNGIIAASKASEPRSQSSLILQTQR